MSRPVGAKFHVPHGLSNAILLPRITQYSVPGAQERYANVSRAVGFADASASDDDACNKLVDGLHALCHDLQVPKLSELGICRADFLSAAPSMSEQALASGSPSNNPVVPSMDTCVSLYEAVYA